MSQREGGSSAGVVRAARIDPARLALVVAAACALCGVAYLGWSLLTRPFGPVEAELAFQASRIQRGFPLYVDPAQGAWELGPPPSRYYVLYTPLWPWFLAHVAPASPVGIRTVGRVLNGLALLGVLGGVVRASKPHDRVAVGTGALLVLGLAMLVREAGLADFDMPAVALATFGLLRAADRGGLDPLAAALLTAAPLVKPSVLGMPVGAFVAHALVHRRSGARRLLTPFVSAALFGGVLIAIFTAWSHGAWLTHIVRATGQTLSAERWLREFGSRAVFLGLPHAVVAVLAIRRRGPLLTTLPLAASLAWSTFSMAKHGSGTQYWLEPSAAALVALGTMPASPEPRAARLLAWCGAAFSALVAVVSIPGFVDAIRKDAERRAEVAAIREHCPLQPGQVLVSSDTSLEMEIEGRIMVPCWQNSYLVRAGQFPLDAWRQDLARPEVRWFVHRPDYLDPPPARIEGITEMSVYRRELHDVIEHNFVLDGRVAGFVVFRRR